MIRTGARGNSPCRIVGGPTKVGMATIVRLKPERCVFLLCDVQERFRSLITKFDAVVNGAHRMLGACNELRIPVLVTEQYPKALGHTCAELDVAGENTRVFEKVCFSMLSDEVSAALAERTFDDAIIVGLEAHVCVQQTTLDLLGMGKRVHLCVDAISSQTAIDRSAGLHRLASSGAIVTTTEARRCARAWHALIHAGRTPLRVTMRVHPLARAHSR